MPNDGKAVRVRSIAPGAGDTDPEVRQQPRPAGPGDTPERVVRGFLAAAKSAPGRHAIARTYLAPDAQAGWNDAAVTRIVTFGAQRVAGSPPAPQVIVTGSYRARLGGDLSYLRDDRPLVVTYALRRVAGEWRIVNPPPGVLLPVADFQQVYRPLDLYFLNPGSDIVIPDRRYFDVKQAVLPTEMASRLLAGPSAWLGPGVTTAFPAGTRLRSNVIRDGELFVVDLSVEVLAASGAQQVALAAQLVWTLAKQFSVSGVRVLADGRPLRVQSQNGVVGRDAYSSYDPQVLLAPVAGYYVADGSARIAGIAGGPGTAKPVTAAGPGLLTAAITADLGLLAAVRSARAGLPGRSARSVAGGLELVTGPVGGPLTPRLVARTLTRPSWEPGADAVFVGVDDAGLVRVAMDGARQSVDTPGLAAFGGVSAVTLSRDGVRVAVVAGPPGAGHLLLAVVQHAGSRIRLSGLREVAPVLTGVVDVAWADEAHLLVLARRSGASVAPYGVDVDGAQVSERLTAGLPADRKRVAAAPGEPDLVEAGGRIWRRQGSLWESPVNGPAPAGSAPFYPG